MRVYFIFNRLLLLAAEVCTSLSVSAGGAAAYRDVTLAPHQWTQINTVAQSILGVEARKTLPNLDNVQVRIDVLAGSGAVIPYATLTDNGTGDTVLRTE